MFGPSCAAACPLNRYGPGCAYECMVLLSFASHLQMSVAPTASSPTAPATPHALHAEAVSWALTANYHAQREQEARTARPFVRQCLMTALMISRHMQRQVSAWNMHCTRNLLGLLSRLLWAQLLDTRGYLLSSLQQPSVLLH